MRVQHGKPFRASRALVELLVTALAGSDGAAADVLSEPGCRRYRREHSKCETDCEQPAQPRLGEHFRHLLPLVDHVTDARKERPCG
jgi:hypothetical protein